MVITDNIKKLLTGIIIMIIILLVCVHVDNATDQKIISSANNTNSNLTPQKMKINETYYVGVSDGKAVKNETVKVKSDLPTVTIKAKPSCGCNYRNPGKYKYRWYTTSFINHCPKCGKWGTLRNVYKPTAKYEYELTCDMRLGGCDADYCGVCGKDKFSWSHYYITLAE